jgi:outer membrane protein OmpA-like peptidoglycan-associated protein
LVQPGAPLRNTIVSCGYLIIRDFGVDWRHVKLAARNEQLFKDWLNQFETNRSLFFRILGYSDCVGIERNNSNLRKCRALNVRKLLGSSARARVMAVAAAPPNTFLTDNSTIAARANNRSVVIEFFVNTPQII